jgi:tripartite-type tricarboxylate transporter receptor subunit TctC
MRFLTGLAIAAFLWSGNAAPLSAQSVADSAEGFPNRLVRIIVPFPPGGPVDMMARVFGQRMSDEWKQPVVIENRAGGNSAIGAQQVARAAPDGHTLLVAMDTTLVMNPLANANLPYDPKRDFVLISLMAQNPALLVVRASDGPATVDELIARYRSAPRKLNYGAGVLPLRLAGFLFNKLAGIEGVFVPYKGSAEVVQGLMTGSIDYSFDGVAANIPLIQSGQLRALAKLGDHPLPALPYLKPLAEAAKLPAMGDVSIWSGMVAPAGTPPAIVDRIHRSIAKIAADSAVQDRLHQVGIGAVSSTPKEFDDFFRRESAKWSQVFAESGFTMN